MKKVFAVILSMLVLVGCTGKSVKIEPVTKGISFSCEITYYNERYECDGEVNNNGEMELEFKYPAGIEGLKFLLSKNGVSAEYKDVQYINDSKAFEKTSAYLIYTVFSKEQEPVLEENEVFYIDGKTDDFDYRLELGATGLPIKITTKPDVAEVIFKNVKIK